MSISAENLLCRNRCLAAGSQRPLHEVDGPVHCVAVIHPPITAWITFQVGSQTFFRNYCYPPKVRNLVLPAPAWLESRTDFQVMGLNYKLWRSYTQKVLCFWSPAPCGTRALSKSLFSTAVYDPNSSSYDEWDLEHSWALTVADGLTLPPILSWSIFWYHVELL